jgi:hypothetical protein
MLRMKSKRKYFSVLSIIFPDTLIENSIHYYVELYAWHSASSKIIHADYY